MTKRYTAYVTVYHKIKVEAANRADALNEIENTIWDNHIKDVVIDLEEQEE